MFRSKALRPIAGVVLITFTALTLQPLTAAAQLPSAPKRAQASSATGEERFSRTLNEIHEILKEVVPQAAMPHMFKSTAPAAAGKPGEKVLQTVGPKMRLESERAKPLPGVDVTAKVKALRGKYKELKSLEGEVDKGFKATEQHIKDKGLPAELLARHEQAVADYAQRKAQFTALMSAVESAADGKGELQGALASLGEFMAKYPNEKTHTPTDPNNLPWGSPKPVTRAPYTSPAQFKTSRLFGETVKVAQAGSLSGISLPTTALPATPNAADLGPTEDVQITQAIRDLAASLGNKPVPIYNWVRNNIQFIPSYGSIQGSDMTLQTKRGNAFDTASLLIALLRSAGVPARYVYGTIEVPADKAMNWVGGVTVPQAAQNLMGQGGIPNVGVGFGGQIRSIRLEHVWVEAFVDYVPSRGAVNRNPITWVPMDASFKQYQFTQGMDIKTNVPFDAQSFLTQALQGTAVNDAEGWVQNINQAQIQQALTNYQTQVANFVNMQKPNAAVGDVLGTQTIVLENRPIFLGTLPYKSIATGAKFQAIPDNLRHKLTMKLYVSDFDRANDSPAIAYSGSLPALAGKRISIAYDPATPADKAVIDNAFNNSQTSYPAYLVRVIPSLKLENAVVQMGSALSIGQDQFFSVTLTKPYDQHEVIYPVTTGDLSVLSLSLSTITQDQFNARISQQDLKKSNVVNPAEEMLYQVALGYWGEYSAFQQTVAESKGVRYAQQPGHGLAAVLVTVQYAFGVARAASYTSRSMDIRENLVAAEASDADLDTRKNYLRTIGQVASFLEGGIWEQAFLMEPGSAVSSVAALALAAQRGIPIHTITDQTVSLALNQLTVAPEVKDRIQNAVAAGYRVAIPRSPLTIGNFTGTGYIIEDPQTGAGFYEISGERQGGGAPAGKAVYALPQAPASPVVAFILGSTLRTAGASLVIEGGVVIGIAIGVAITAALLAAIILWILLTQSQSKTIDEKYPRTNLRLRHYTDLPGLIGITTIRFIFQSLSGLLGPGVYFANADDEDQRGFGCPPNSLAIVTRFQIPPPPAAPDPTRVTGFADIRITRLNYYDIESQTNPLGETEIVIRAPLLPTPVIDPATGVPRLGLFIGAEAFGLEFEDVCGL